MSTLRKDDGVPCANGLILIDESLMHNCEANTTDCGLPFHGLHLTKFNHKSIEEYLVVRDGDWLLREFPLDGLFSCSYEEPGREHEEGRPWPHGCKPSQMLNPFAGLIIASSILGGVGRLYLFRDIYKPPPLGVDERPIARRVCAMAM